MEQRKENMRETLQKINDVTERLSQIKQVTAPRQRSNIVDSRVSDAATGSTPCNYDPNYAPKEIKQKNPIKLDNKDLTNREGLKKLSRKRSSTIKPLLYIDVDIGEAESERIIVF